MSCVFSCFCWRALICTDCSGRSVRSALLLQGFAYVEFETREGLQNAVDMTGVEFGGKILQIKVSDSARGGAGRGTRGGRGGRSAPRGQHLALVTSIL